MRGALQGARPRNAGGACKLAQGRLALLPRAATSPSLLTAPPVLSAGAASPATLLLLALHAAIHLYYIVTWTSKHTLRVLHLSSDDSGRRRFAGGYGAAELAWWVAG